MTTLIMWMFILCYMIPLVEAILFLIGMAWARWHFRTTDTFTQLIIQVTTVGKEHELVQHTIDTINSYQLTMPYEIWAVIEPGHHTDYRGAEVMVVPADFTCKPIDKARALEYSRLQRVARGLNRADVKIILLDDDTLPTKTYINKAFSGDYDVCQGVTVPSRQYGRHTFRHFLLSHIDNIRTRNCLIWCSCTQGVLQKPLFVHGEGLCITGRAEDIVTWNRKIVASDDLVFGTNAAHIGLRWGYFHAAIQLVSPWTFKEAFNQRWRWTWGNIDAIISRDIMPLGFSVFKAAKYLIGYITVTIGTIGWILWLFWGVSKIPEHLHLLFWVSLFVWWLSFGVSAWVNTGGPENRAGRSRLRFWAFRIVQTILALLPPITLMTALMPLVMITLGILRGRPKQFVMINKQRR